MSIIYIYIYILVSVQGWTNRTLTVHEPVKCSHCSVGSFAETITE